MFRIGDVVEAIDDDLKGKVIEVDHEEILLETVDGFRIKMPVNALIKVNPDQEIKVTNYEVHKIISEKETSKKKHTQKVKPKERNAPKMEVDLHINQLIANPKPLSNHEMLTLQLDVAKQKLEYAIRNKIQKVVFIHGVGEGILKLELTYLFGRYDNVIFYDADYKKYGLGATEVYIRQSG